MVEEKDTKRLEAATRTYEWRGTEDQQHRERIRACRSRRKTYPDDDCDRDGSCTECEYDMHAALETPASKARRRDALIALRGIEISEGGKLAIGEEGL